MKYTLKTFTLATMLVALPATGHAANPILASLQSKGVEAVQMDEQQLNNARGAALITGQPLPSVTTGLKTHMVTWKKFGSQTDYRSYSWEGSSYDTTNNYIYSEDGVNSYYVAGDRWLADKVSNVNSWNAANATLIDLHLQILDPNTKAPSNYGFRSTSWNRPISTFSW